MHAKFRKSDHQRRGFSLLEVMVALLVLLVGVVAIAELVPGSVTANNSNRTDSVALVVSQRVLDQMLDQPITAVTCSAASAPPCPDAGISPWSLGNPGSPNTVVGSPVVLVGGRATINFSAGQVANYSFNYTDPNDPYGASYDVRWAVITSVNNGNVTSKRFIISGRQLGGAGYIQPLTLDTMVEK